MIINRGYNYWLKGGFRIEYSCHGDIQILIVRKKCVLLASDQIYYSNRGTATTDDNTENFDKMQ